MLDAWRDGYDVVHTRKVMTEDLGRTRAAVTRLAYRAIGWVASVRLVPQASDFRLLDRAARDRVCALPERGRLYRGLTPWVGYRQTVLPFVAPARAHGSSNYSFRQLVNLFTRSFFDFSSAPLYAALILATGRDRCVFCVRRLRAGCACDWRANTSWIRVAHRCDSVSQLSESRGDRSPQRLRRTDLRRSTRSADIPRCTHTNPSAVDHACTCRATFRLGRL